MDFFQDVTSMFTVLSVAGPKSRDLMQEMTHSDMNMHPFTYKYDPSFHYVHLASSNEL